MPRKSEQRKAYERIKKILDAAKDKLVETGMAGQFPDIVIRVHENADGTVDGEILVREIPRGLTVREIFLSIEEVLPKSIPHVWISNGIRRFTAFNPRADKEDEIEEQGYERWRGMVGAGTYYQRATPQKVPINFVTARQMDVHMRDKRRRKAEQVYTRLHWNKKNEKPSRR